MSSEFQINKNDLRFEFNYDNEKVLMEFNSTNFNDVQQTQLHVKPDFMTNVHVNAYGSGIGFVAVSCNFVRQVDSLQPSFFLSVVPELSSKEKVISLKICTNYFPKEFESHGMAIVEAEIPSGFRFQDSSLIYQSLLQSKVGVRVRKKILSL